RDAAHHEDLERAVVVAQQHHGRGQLGSNRLLRNLRGAVVEAERALGVHVQEEVALQHQSVSLTVTSTSTGEPSGRTATPTAERACLPASPKTSPRNSLAPLMTPGWPVKSGALETNPVTFTTCSMRSRSPISALIAASALIAQVRASSFARS